MELNLECAINSLSYGQITYGVLNELYNRNVFPNIFPRMNQVDLAAYDTASARYKEQLQIGINKAYVNYNKSTPYLNIWHIHGGSWAKISEPSYLLTFHELDSLTKAEVNIVNSYNKVFVTSTYSKQVFEDSGVNIPVIAIPLGIDTTQTFTINKPYLTGQATVWSIIGKFENRKHTKRAIQGWIKLYGGNPLHRLHLFITNPFVKQEQMNQIFADIFNNAPLPSNVILFGYQPTNSLMNDAFNATDIIIDMSGGEALSLPSLSCVALGKHAVIHNCTAMKDWANSENAVLVEPSGVIPVYDNMFFRPNEPFNQGNIYTWEESDYLKGLQNGYSRWLQNKTNEAGKQLTQSYNYSVGTNIILKEIYGN